MSNREYPGWGIRIFFSVIFSLLVLIFLWNIKYPPKHEPVPLPTPTDITSKFNVANSPLQDCKILKLDYITVVRCPNSVTGAEYQVGKNSFAHTVTVDGK